MIRLVETSRRFARKGSGMNGGPNVGSGVCGIGPLCLKVLILEGLGLKSDRI